MANQDVIITIKAADQVSDPMRGIASVFAQTGANIEGSFGGSLGRLSSMMITPQTAAIGTMVAIGAAAYKMGTDWEDTVFKMESVFGVGADAMIEKAKYLSEATGDYFTTQDFAGAFAKVADVLDTMGLTANQQFAVVAAAADIAAVRGLGLEDTVTGIAKALGGAGKAGMQYGIVLKDNYMQTVAFGGSLKEIWTGLSATDKEQLRYLELLNQTAKYAGDAAEKSETLAGGIHSLWNEVKEAYTPGGPSGKISETLGALFPGLGPVLQQMAELWDVETKAQAAAIGLKSAQAAANTELANAVSAMNKLAASAASYEGRTGAEAQADAQKRISIELANQASLEAELKALEADRSKSVSSLEKLEEQLAELVRTNTGDLYTDNFSQQQALMAKISDAKTRIHNDDVGIVAQEQAIQASQVIQNQLAWDKVSAAAALAQKMAYQAAYTGAVSTFDEPGYQKQITGLMDDQAAAQKQIITLEQQRFMLEHDMANLPAWSKQYQDDATKLQAVNTQLDYEKSQVSYITDVLKGLEVVRLTALQDSVPKVIQQAKDLADIIDALHEKQPSFDTSVMEAQLTDLNNRIFAFQANIEKAVAAMGGANALAVGGVSTRGNLLAPAPQVPQVDINQLEDMSLQGVDAGRQWGTGFWTGVKGDPVPPIVATVDDTGALGVIAQIGNALGALSQQVIPVTISMQMAMSPAVPFSQGIADLQGYFARVPQNMYTTINMAISGGDTLSQALAYWEAILKYQPIISTMNAEIQVAGASMSGMLYAAATMPGFHGAGVDFSVLEYSQAAAKAFIANNQLKYLEAVAALQDAAPKGTAAAGTTGTAAAGTTTTTQNTGVILNFDVQINLTGGPTGMDTAVTIATQFDSQLASMILAKRSQIVAALVSMGYVKVS